MRIGLYGLPTSGKTYILDHVKNIEVLSGSKLLKEMEPDFDNLSEYGDYLTIGLVAKMP